jgi:hypothetical protein
MTGRSGAERSAELFIAPEKVTRRRGGRPMFA